MQLMYCVVMATGPSNKITHQLRATGKHTSVSPTTTWPSAGFHSFLCLKALFIAHVEFTDCRGKKNNKQYEGIIFFSKKF